MIFHARSVNAILAGRKSQTRRIITPQLSPDAGDFTVGIYHPTVVGRRGIEEPGPETFGVYSNDGGWGRPSRCGRPGDRIWVKETWQTHCDKDTVSPRDLPPNTAVQYPATYDHWKSKRRSSMFMPRWASRITLEIVSVKVERAHQITDADVMAEGVDPIHVDKYRKFFHKNDVHAMAFAELWDETNGKGSWASNPWLWCIEFRRVPAAKGEE